MKPQSNRLEGGLLEAAVSSAGGREDNAKKVAPSTPQGVLPRVQDVLVVLVTSRRTGHTRRQLYLSLSSAEKAVERAAARGDCSDLVLCRLHPVGCLAVVGDRG